VPWNARHSQAGGPPGMPKKATTPSGRKARAAMGSTREAEAMNTPISQAEHFSAKRRTVGMRAISKLPAPGFATRS